MMIQVLLEDPGAGQHPSCDKLRHAFRLLSSNQTTTCCLTSRLCTNKVRYDISTHRTFAAYNLPCFKPDEDGGNKKYSQDNARQSMDIVYSCLRNIESVFGRKNPSLKCNQDDARQENCHCFFVLTKC